MEQEWMDTGHERLPGYEHTPAIFLLFALSKGASVT